MNGLSAEYIYNSVAAPRKMPNAYCLFHYPITPSQQFPLKIKRCCGPCDVLNGCGFDRFFVEQKSAQVGGKI
jgi:hypothetical protein